MTQLSFELIHSCIYRYRFLAAVYLLASLVKFNLFSFFYLCVFFYAQFLTTPWVSSTKKIPLITIPILGLIASTCVLIAKASLQVFLSLHPPYGSYLDNRPILAEVLENLGFDSFGLKKLAYGFYSFGPTVLVFLVSIFGIFVSIKTGADRVHVRLAIPKQFNQIINIGSVFLFLLCGICFPNALSFYYFVCFWIVLTAFCLRFRFHHWLVLKWLWVPSMIYTGCHLFLVYLFEFPYFAKHYPVPICGLGMDLNVHIHGGLFSNILLCLVLFCVLVSHKVDTVGKNDLVKKITNNWIYLYMKRYTASINFLLWMIWAASFLSWLSFPLLLAGLLGWVFPSNKFAYVMPVAYLYCLALCILAFVYDLWNIGLKPHPQIGVTVDTYPLLILGAKVFFTTVTGFLLRTSKYWDNFVVSGPLLKILISNQKKKEDEEEADVPLLDDDRLPQVNGGEVHLPNDFESDICFAHDDDHDDDVPMLDGSSSSNAVCREHGVGREQHDRILRLDTRQQQLISNLGAGFRKFAENVIKIMFSTAEYSYLLALILVFICSLKRVTLLNAVYMIFFLVYLIFPRFAIRTWVLLVLYCEWAITVCYLFRLNAFKGFISPEFAKLIGFQEDEDTLLVAWAWHIMILAVSVIQLWVFDNVKTLMSHGYQKDEEKHLFTEIFQLAYRYISSLWLFFCFVALVTVALTDMSMVKTGFLLFFYLLIIVNQISENPIALVSRLWLLLPVYTGVVLIMAYTYQFDYMSNLVHNFVSQEILKEIGFEKRKGDLSSYLSNFSLILWMSWLQIRIFKQGKNGLVSIRQEISTIALGSDQDIQHDVDSEVHPHTSREQEVEKKTKNVDNLLKRFINFSKRAAVLHSEQVVWILMISLILTYIEANNVLTLVFYAFRIFFPKNNVMGCLTMMWIQAVTVAKIFAQYSFLQCIPERQKDSEWFGLPTYADGAARHILLHIAVISFLALNRYSRNNWGVNNNLYRPVLFLSNGEDFRSSFTNYITFIINNIFHLFGKMVVIAITLIAVFVHLNVLSWVYMSLVAILLLVSSNKLRSFFWVLMLIPVLSSVCQYLLVLHVLPSSEKIMPWASWPDGWKTWLFLPPYQDSSVIAVDLVLLLLYRCYWSSLKFDKLLDVNNLPPITLLSHFNFSRRDWNVIRKIELFVMLNWHYVPLLFSIITGARSRSVLSLSHVVLTFKCFNDGRDLVLNKQLRKKRMNSLLICVYLILLIKICWQFPAALINWHALEHNSLLVRFLSVMSLSKGLTLYASEGLVLAWSAEGILLDFFLFLLILSSKVVSSSDLMDDAADSEREDDQLSEKRAVAFYSNTYKNDKAKTQQIMSLHTAVNKRIEGLYSKHQAMGSKDSTLLFDKPQDLYDIDNIFHFKDQDEGKLTEEQSPPEYEAAHTEPSPKLSPHERRRRPTNMSIRSQSCDNMVFTQEDTQFRKTLLERPGLRRRSTAYNPLSQDRDKNFSLACIPKEWAKQNRYANAYQQLCFGNWDTPQELRRRRKLERRTEQLAKFRQQIEAENDNGEHSMDDLIFEISTSSSSSSENNYSSGNDSSDSSNEEDFDDEEDYPDGIEKPENLSSKESVLFDKLMKKPTKRERFITSLNNGFRHVFVFLISSLQKLSESYLLLHSDPERLLLLNGNIDEETFSATVSRRQSQRSLFSEPTQTSPGPSISLDDSGNIDHSSKKINIPKKVSPLKNPRLPASLPAHVKDVNPRDRRSSQLTSARLSLLQPVDSELDFLTPGYGSLAISESDDNNSDGGLPRSSTMSLSWIASSTEKSSSLSMLTPLELEVLRKPTFTMVDKHGLMSEMKHTKKQMFSKRFDPSESAANIFKHLSIALNAFFYAHTLEICCGLIFINNMAYNNILSLFLPVLLCGWGLLCHPFPPPNFWSVMIVYVEIVICLKYLFQLDWIVLNKADGPYFTAFHYIGLQEVESLFYFVVWDMILLLGLLLHKVTQQRLGIWNMVSDLKHVREGRVKGIEAQCIASFYCSESHAPTKIPTCYMPHTEDYTYDMNNDTLTVPPSSFVPTEFRILKTTELKLHKKLNMNTFSTFDDSFFAADSDFIDVNQFYDFAKLPDYHPREGAFIPATTEVNSRTKFIRTIKNKIEALTQEGTSSVPKDRYSHQLFLDAISFIIIMFGWSYISNDGGNISSYLTDSQIPLRFVFTLMLYSFVMIIDRAIYLSRSIVSKIVLHITLLLSVHIVLLCMCDRSTTRFGMISKGNVLGIWYFFRSCYFYFSAVQIKYGFPSSLTPSLLTKNFNLPNNMSFRVFRAIPFVHELKSLLDWAFTPTTLQLMEWWKLEDMYATLFLVKCGYVGLSKEKRLLGEKQPYWIKFMQGVLLSLGLMLVIWSPLLLVSFGRVTAVAAPPTLVSLKLSINHVTLWSMNAGENHVRNVNETVWTSLFKDYGLSQYRKQDVFSVEMESSSRELWTVSPPARKQLLKGLLNFTENIDLLLEYTVQREAQSGSSNEDVLFGSHSIQLASDKRQVLADMINRQDKSASIDNLVPKSLVVPTSGVVNELPLLDPDEDNYLKCTLRMANEGQSEWWVFTLEEDVLKNVENKGDIVIMTVNEPAVSGHLSMITSKGVIGIYISVVLVAGRFLRMAVTDLTYRIMYEDLVNPDILIMLVLDIFTCRKAGNLYLEEVLWRHLLEIYRDPRKMKLWTNPRLQINS